MSIKKVEREDTLILFLDSGYIDGLQVFVLNIIHGAADRIYFDPRLRIRFKAAPLN